MLADISLDSSQEAVASAPAEERQFVQAAAGQGKTEVLVSRILYLMEEGLNPADEILVLSFSRAAVEAVRKRARNADLESVQIRTFDSFAAQILLDESDADEALSGSFDSRIRQATELLKGENVPDRALPLKHILIDEAQDLVGDRAEMVKALLDACDEDLGFTVLGDPLQGIYDFQLDESESQLSSAEFVADLHERYGAEFRSLENHYRARSDQARELIAIGDRIRGMDPGNAVGMGHRLLDEFRVSEGNSSSLLDETACLEPVAGGTTALLCSTNYEVLISSELLWAAGYPHVVRRRAQDMSVAPWVYRVFRDIQARPQPRATVLQLLENEGLDEDKWLDLKTAEGDFRSYESLDVGRLARRLRGRSVPLSLTVSDQAPLTVSTVHRAKGLEFDNILYVPPIPGWPGSEKDEPGLKQKYVALSRAREMVITTRIPKHALVSARTTDKPSRWSEVGYGKGKLPYVKRLEFLNDDVESVFPVGAVVAEKSDVLPMERMTEDLIGELVTGELYTDDFDSVPRYLLRIGSGEIIGRTSDKFGYAMKRAYSIRPGSNWPKTFSGCRVTSIECAAGSPEDTHYAGLGDSGMWLLPRLTGLIKLEWK
ncbi:UvrD-helicase domain-containing protein [Arthrobacter citreus]|uniref:UvrD-helicase domain-containing protein n=1 Tax=Arthrobacter citreus TaxID=1670 RepID=UPI0031F8057B